MSYEPKFNVPIYQRQSLDGIQGTIEECSRAAEILSNDVDDSILSLVNPNTNANTVAFFMGCIDFPERFNEYPELLRLAYSIYQKRNYEDINNFLREKKGNTNGEDKIFDAIYSDGKEILKCSAENIIAALDLLIENEPPTKQDMIVNRSTNLEEIFTDINIDEIDDASQLIGKTYTNYGYASTSPKPVTFGNFTGNTTVLAIKIPKGTSVLGPIASSGECEVVLGRGYSFKIIGFEKIGSKYHVYVELQPREKELDLKSVDEIKKPELVKGDKYPEALSLLPFGKPQQDIIEFQEERKRNFLIKSKKMQIIKILNNHLERIKQNCTRYKNDYDNLLLQDNMINTGTITQELSQIISSVKDGEYEVNELTAILGKVASEQQSFSESIEKLQEEYEDRYVKALGKRVDFLIRETEVEEIDERINQLKSENITLVERIFGKEKLYKTMIANLERQKEKTANTKDRKYDTKEEILARIIDDVQKNGLSNRLNTFINLYCYKSYGIATDDERKMLMDLVSNSNPRKKEYVKEKIPLLSIRKRTKAIQEETKNMDIEEKVLSIQYEESQLVRKLTHYLKTELEPYLEGRKRATSEKEKNDDELIIE